MPTNFPGSLDNFTNPQASDPLSNPAHAGQHANINDAVEAVEAKLGVGSSTPTNVGDVLTVTGTGITAYQPPGGGAASSLFLASQFR